MLVEGTDSHLHPLEHRVPPCLRPEASGIEVGAELAVEDVEDIGDQRRREAGRVVVRRLDASAILDEVDAEEQQAVGPECAFRLRQKGRALVRLEEADRRAEEDDEPVAASRQAVQMPLEVAEQAEDLDAGVALREPGCRSAQRRDGGFSQLPRPQWRRAFRQRSTRRAKAASSQAFTKSACAE